MRAVQRPCHILTAGNTEWGGGGNKKKASITGTESMALTIWELTPLVWEQSLSPG